ncbi:putative RNA-directed DNA polymerase from transposon BS, partial [Trichonephila clavipes]
MVASIYIPPNPNYRNLSADLDTLFKIFNTAIVAGDYNAKHTSWGCGSSDPRVANSTQEIDDQVSNLTTEILNAHASASRPFYQTERPQQAWEDNLLTLNAEDNSLWGIAKAFRKKKPPQSPPLMALPVLLSVIQIKQKYFPKSWKTAVVVPILKPGKIRPWPNHTDLSVYFLSLVNWLKKLFWPDSTTTSKEKNPDSGQHGFRPRLSTSHQLLRVVEFIKEGNNNDECTAAVFLDIQKAFDR